MKILNIDGKELPVNVEGYHAVQKDGVLYEVPEWAIEIAVNKIDRILEFCNDRKLEYSNILSHKAPYQPLSSPEFEEFGDEEEVILFNGNVKELLTVRAVKSKLKHGAVQLTDLWCPVPKMRGM